MATRYISRSLLTFNKQTLATAVSGSSTFVPNSKSFLFRLRPLLTRSCHQHVTSVFPTRNLSTRPATPSLSDPNPKLSNRPPEETKLVVLDGCDFEHWLVMVEKPEGEATREEIIDGYIKTLASVVGSEQEARMKIYNVSTRHYFAFGFLGNEELSNKLKDLPNVRWVIPDSFEDVKNKDYGGEPFINGEAVPYDPKYHKDYLMGDQPSYRNRPRINRGRYVNARRRCGNTWEDGTTVEACNDQIT